MRISRKIRVAEKFIKSIHLLSRRVFVIIVGTFNRICTRQIRSCGLTLQMHKFIFFTDIPVSGNLMEVIMKKKAFFTSRNITFLAVLLALVIVLQIFGGYIKIGPVNFTLTLVPIVLGAVMLGPLAGLILGFAFGLITLINGRRRQRRVHLLSLFAATCPSRRSSALSKRSRRGWLQVTRIGSS